MSQNGTSDWHNSIVGFGIIVGAAIGAIVGLILASGSGLALGGVFGAAVGVVLGAVARNLNENRS